MRKFLLLVFCICVINCGPRQYLLIPGHTLLTALDLTRYQDAAFLITPYKYPMDYESVGSLSVEVIPAAEYKRILTPLPNYPKRMQYRWVFEEIQLDAALERLYEKAVSMGADAIIDLKIEDALKLHRHAIKATGDEYALVGSRQVEAKGYRISGFAIKRLGAFTSKEGQ